MNDVQPPDASVGVPLNSEIRVLYFGFLSNEYFDPTCDLDLRPLRLLPSMGEPIYLTGTVLPRPEAQQAWVIAKHVEPLAASTTYAVQLLLGPGEDPCRCGAREWTTVSSFTSGEAEDHEPPTFAGIESLEYGDRVQGSSTCGDSDVIPTFLELTPVSDAAPAPRYNVYVNGQIATRYVEQLGTEQFGELFVDCRNLSPAAPTALVPGASVELRGVDLAGNESAPNTPLTLDVTCGDPTPVHVVADPTTGLVTTGIDTVPTDPPASVPPSGPSDSSSGCDLSRRPPTSGGAHRSIAAAAFLLLVGRFASRARARKGQPRPVTLR